MPLTMHNLLRPHRKNAGAASSSSSAAASSSQQYPNRKSPANGSQDHLSSSSSTTTPVPKVAPQLPSLLPMSPTFETDSPLLASEPGPSLLSSSPSWLSTPRTLPPSGNRTDSSIRHDASSEGKAGSSGAMNNDKSASASVSISNSTSTSTSNASNTSHAANTSTRGFVGPTTLARASDDAHRPLFSDEDSVQLRPATSGNIGKVKPSSRPNTSGPASGSTSHTGMTLRLPLLSPLPSQPPLPPLPPPASAAAAATVAPPQPSSKRHNAKSLLHPVSLLRRRRASHNSNNSSNNSSNHNETAQNMMQQDPESVIPGIIYGTRHPDWSSPRTSQSSPPVKVINVKSINFDSNRRISEGRDRNEPDLVNFIPRVIPTDLPGIPPPPVDVKERPAAFKENFEDVEPSQQPTTVNGAVTIVQEKQLASGNNQAISGPGQVNEAVNTKSQSIPRFPIPSAIAGAGFVSNAQNSSAMMTAPSFNAIAQSTIASQQPIGTASSFDAEPEAIGVAVSSNQATVPRKSLNKGSGPYSRGVTLFDGPVPSSTDKDAVNNSSRFSFEGSTSSLSLGENAWERPKNVEQAGYTRQLKSNRVLDPDDSDDMGSVDMEDLLDDPYGEEDDGFGRGEDDDNDGFGGVDDSDRFGGIDDNDGFGNDNEDAYGVDGDLDDSLAIEEEDGFGNDGDHDALPVMPIPPPGLNFPPGLKPPPGLEIPAGLKSPPGFESSSDLQVPAVLSSPPGFGPSPAGLLPPPGLAPPPGFENTLGTTDATVNTPSPTSGAQPMSRDSSGAASLGSADSHEEEDEPSKYPPFINPIGGGLSVETHSFDQFYSSDGTRLELEGITGGVGAVHPLPFNNSFQYGYQGVGEFDSTLSPASEHEISDFRHLSLQGPDDSTGPNVHRYNSGYDDDNDDGYGDLEGVNDDDYDEGDMSMIAEANREALESDAEGWYGQEFGFYPASLVTGNGNQQEQLVATAGGVFGFDELLKLGPFRNPSLTPISERSESSYRNSINLPGGAMHQSFPGINIGALNAALLARASFDEQGGSNRQSMESTRPPLPILEEMT